MSSGRLDHQLIQNIINANSSVLDLGCGDGTLMSILKTKGCTVQGIEIDSKLVLSSVNKGFSVVQQDLDEGLKDFQDESFDYVVLNKTLQATTKPLLVLRDSVRIGKKVVVSFNNFAYWLTRSQLFLYGTMPKSKDLPYEWHDTPNIHLVTIKDFDNFCEQNKFTVLQKIYYSEDRVLGEFLPNLLSPYAMFVLGR
jgi:methionine biosynthesis protein MetW